MYTLCSLRQKHSSLTCCSFLHQPQSLLLHYTLRFHKGRTIIDACAFKARQVFHCGFRYSAPVAITTVRVEILAPFLDFTSYGLRSQTSRVPFAMSMCRTELLCLKVCSSRELPDRRYRWEIPSNFRFLSLNLPDHQENLFPAPEHRVLLKRHILRQPDLRDQPR